MKIGIIGSGNIGGTLGRRWAESGHDIFFGVRDPQRAKLQALMGALNGRVQAGSVAAAVAFGEVVLLAVPSDAAQEAVAQGAKWQDTVLIDATNRFSSPSPPSLSQEIATWAVGARVVKAFNTAGFETLTNPQYGSQRATTFLCGDDEAAKRMVAELAATIGLDAVDVGPLANAPLLDSLTRLWAAATQTRGRGIAFALLTRT